MLVMLIELLAPVMLLQRLGLNLSDVGHAIVLHLVYFLARSHCIIFLLKAI